jgi:L,D-transpeptidase ErfK/SrfK
VFQKLRRLVAVCLAATAFAAAVALAGEREPELRPLIGRNDSALVADGETLLDIAYQRRLGFDAVARLNPEVDPWIPVPGTVVVLPTRMILPVADEEGLVVNIPEMRLYDFTVKDGPEVFAIAIGDQADPSLIGNYRVGVKHENPTWRVPKSIREEKPELPALVPPGPDNPLGSRWMTIGATSYGIHGTNVRWSIGRIATHGCIRLYDDEIQRLYARVREGTQIQILYQRWKWGLDGDRIYLETHPDLYGHQFDRATMLDLPQALGLLEAIDVDLAHRVLDEARGVPVQVGKLPPPISSRSY